MQNHSSSPGTLKAHFQQLADPRLGRAKRQRTPEMQHIDYGLSVLTPRAFNGLESRMPLDLAEVFQKLVAAGELAGYEVRERFYEAGSAEGLTELEALLGTRT